MKPETQALLRKSQDYEKIWQKYSAALADCEASIQSHLESEIPAVTQIARHLIAGGGKRLRPLLVIMAADLCGYMGPRNSTFGTVLEYIHSATLLHDDVIDHADLRRGRPSANAIWDNKSSVLVGDFFYCRASSLIAQDGDIQVLATITEATERTTEGEILEIYKSRDIGLTQEEYFKIVEFKTGVLMACSMEVGGILGEASPEQKQALRSYGINLGVSFQLADDALDYNSSEKEFGKTNGTDLKEGKVTLPILYALQAANESERSFIKECLSKAHAGDLEKMMALLNKYECLEKTLNLAQVKSAEARESLAIFPESEAKELLETLTHYVFSRKI